MSERRSARLRKTPEDAEPAPEPPKERKTTARKSRGKKKTEEPSEAPAAAPDATTELVDLLTPRLQEQFPDTPTEDVRQILLTTIESMYPIADRAALLELEEDQEAILESAATQLAPPEEAPVEEEPGSAAAAAPAAEPSPVPAAPSPAELLEEARRRQAATKPDSDEEEDTPATSPQQVMSIKVPITGPAIQYTIEVKEKSPGPVPMDASQATASQGEVEEEEEVTQTTVRWYPVTDATFPEKLGERFNLIFPAHKMAPVSWSDMKDAHRENGETYYAFTVAESAPGAVFGEDYTLLTGDPKKVVATGVLNTHKSTATGAFTVNILDMGTREDKIPKGGAVNPFLVTALKSFASQAAPTVVVRYSRKQMLSDPEYLSTRNTLASLGIPMSSFTAGGPGGKEALFKVRGETNPVDIASIKLRPSETGADRILYEYREEGTGAVKSFPGSAVDKVYVLTRRGTELSPIVEFVGTVGAILTEGGEERDITLPDAVLRDGFKRVEPRRGGRKRTQRKRATSRRSS